MPLPATAPMSAWIDHFVKSSAPHLSSLSKAKRIQMAIAAKNVAMQKNQHENVACTKDNISESQEKIESKLTWPTAKISSVTLDKVREYKAPVKQKQETDDTYVTMTGKLPGTKVGTETGSKDINSAKKDEMEKMDTKSTVKKNANMADETFKK